MSIHVRESLEDFEIMHLNTVSNIICLCQNSNNAKLAEIADVDKHDQIRKTKRIILTWN